MKILSVECSACSVSCAITEDGKLRSSYYLNMNMTHSQTLMPMLENMLKLMGEKPQSIDAFAVSAGPGSFTGVRIGIAAIKGLAFGRNSCIAVSPLEAMAYNFSANECIICGAMDARCNQVYNGMFKVSRGKVERLIPDRALTIPELIEELQNSEYDLPIILAGDGAHLVYKAASEKGLENISLAPENLRYQNAVGIAFAAEMLYNEGKTLSADELLPIYLRLPQAERELKAKKSREEVK